MCKKIGLAAIAVVAGLFILNSTHLGSYARTAFHKVRTAAKKQVPLEFQLESIRTEAAQLIPDMRKNLSLIAHETVAVQNLRDEIHDIQANLDKQKDHVRAMRDDLKSGDQKVVYNNRPISADRLREKLATQLNQTKRCQESLEAKTALLEAREKSLDTAREQLASMKAQKEQMEVQIAQIEAELKTLRLAQTRSSFQLDDSRLSRIKGALADVRNQMKVQQTEAVLLGEWDNETIPSQKKAPSNAQLMKEVDEFLGGSPIDEKVVGGTK